MDEPDIMFMTNSLRNWLDLKHAEVRQALTQDGGWERWLQVEMALFLTTQLDTLGHDATIKREQRVYQDARSLVDLCYMPHYHNQAVGSYVEFKTESLNAQPGPFFFATTIDLYKVFHGRLKNKYLPGRLWAVVMYYTTTLDNPFEEQFRKYAASSNGHYGFLVQKEHDPVRVIWACTARQDVSDSNKLLPDKITVEPSGGDTETGLFGQ